MSKKKAPVDYALLVDCADSFQKMGELFIDGIYQRFPEGTSWKPPSGLGELVCCVTNLSFSLELYLKALHAKLGEAYLQEHDLSKLYMSLPSEVRQAIERNYGEYVKSIPPGVHASITVAKGPEASPKWRNYSKEPKDLASVLNRSRDIFRSWRYIFEVRLQSEGSYEIHEFEYLLLHLACKALRTQLKPKDT
jgi:HEPN domain-containing protein